MHRLATKFGDQSGAISLIVILMISGGIIFSLFSIVVDGGSVFVEKRVLQNASDSAVLSIVAECAQAKLSSDGTVPTTPKPCNATVNTLTDFSISREAQILLNGNSPDNATTLDSFCGPSLTVQCTGAYEGCTYYPSGFPTYLRVTGKSDGAGLVPTFKKLINPVATSSTYLGKKCSQAAWGSATKVSVYFPLVVSICAYGQQFDKTVEVTLYQQVLANNYPSCTITDFEGNTRTFTDPVNKGIAVMSDPLNPNCDPALSSTILLGTDLIRQQSVPQFCNSLGQVRLEAERLSGNGLLLPVVQYNSATSQYKVTAFVSFRVTAYKIKNDNFPQPSYPNLNQAGMDTFWGKGNCGANTICLKGYFQTKLVLNSPVSANDPSTYPSLGIRAIQLLS